MRALLASGDRVRALDDLSLGDPRYLEEVADHIELVQASILDAGAVQRAAEGSTAIVHLAADSGVPRSVANPARDFEVNVRGTFNVFEAARRAQVASVVFASSGAVLAGADPPLREDLAPKPLAPYGASKLYGEGALQAFSSAYGMLGVSLRFANVYGPYCAHKSSVVAVFLRRALSGQPFLIDGNGEQTRDFVNVGDITAAILRAVESDRSGLFHLGTGRETSVAELAALAADAAGVPLRLEHGPGRAADAARNYPDTTRARTELAWTPEISLPEGLAGTCEWLARWDASG